MVINLFLIRWSINVASVILMLFIFLNIYMFGGVILIEPNLYILIPEIVIVIIGIILNIYAFKEHLEGL